MPKYLVQVNYTLEGVRGVLKDGGSSRRAVVERVIAGVGGTMESFYFCFGKYDVVVIADLPDNAAIAAISLTVGASGAAEVQTTALLTPEEIDDATKRTVAYTAPGAARARAARATAAGSTRSTSATRGRAASASSGRAASASSGKAAGSSSGKAAGSSSGKGASGGRTSRGGRAKSG
jgi:uncharacterized protein with GYD domain